MSAIHVPPYLFPPILFWLRLSVPEGKQASDIQGDIDDSLISILGKTRDMVEPFSEVCACTRVCSWGEAAVYLGCVFTSQFALLASSPAAAAAAVVFAVACGTRGGVQGDDDDVLFCINWMGRSHIHNTWHTGTVRFACMRVAAAGHCTCSRMRCGTGLCVWVYMCVCVCAEMFVRVCLRVFVCA